jgi:hypothetical protein
MQPERKEVDRWSVAAPFWEGHRDVIHQMFAQVTQALVEDGWLAADTPFRILRRAQENRP